MNKSNLIAIFILAGMLFLMVMSSRGDSATFDEVAHIGAGYSYLTQKDGRLNPEHPPLIKSLSAIPLLFLNLDFSLNQPFWTLKNVNDRQWAAGNYLLYESGNNADQILFWSRLPVIVLALFFGFVIFWWTKKTYGAKTGLLALLLFSLSPTFLAHSRLVTTDLGASLAFFLSAIFFIKFLEKNDKKSSIFLGVVFGLSLLVKFSLVILLPFFLILIIWEFLNPYPRFRRVLPLRKGEKREEILPSPLRRVEGGQGGLGVIGNLALATIVMLATIYIFYIPQVWNYPPEQNLADAHYTLGGYKIAQFVPKIDFWLLSNQFTRPFGQYLHGFLMAAQRTAGGNSAYFLGEVSSKGWISYFPTLFFTKEQLGLYILMFIAIIFGNKNRKKQHSTEEIIFLFFIAYYWAWSLWSPLNIGIRHILPTLPFIYILISKSITEWTNGNFWKKSFVFGLILWMLIEVVLAFPYFLSYYNRFGGGVRNGYKIATDSNYDWGQDLKRLKIWMENKKINKIYIDYFGGGSLKYYFGDKAEIWRYEKGPPPAGSYFAISANSLIGAEKLYYWLKDRKPEARAGSSIFIFSF